MNLNRASRELQDTARIRKGCPLEKQLRYRRYKDAYDVLRLAEQCLAEINHCYALRLTAFKPGDHLLVKTTFRGFPPDPHRYLVLDVLWRKGDSYTLVVHELTKSGALHKGRYPTWLTPSSRISIEFCDEPLPKETQWRAEPERRGAEQLIVEILEKGDLSGLLSTPPTPQASAARPHPFWARQ